MTAVARALHAFWQRNEEEAPLGALWVVLGPASLSMSLILAYAHHHYDLIAVGVLGIIASSLGFRRVFYSLLLLAIAAPVGHLMHADAHLWRLGLECTIGCAFLVTALAIEQGDAYLAQLNAQIEARESTLQTLQEELSARVVAVQEKLDRAQTELQALDAEKASILTLNEVIRHAAAADAAERELLKEEVARLRTSPLTAERVAELEQQVAHLQSKQQELAGAASALRELRKQFDERGHVLHKARVELFHAQTRLEAEHRRSELALQEPDPLQKIVESDLAALDQESAQLFQENQLLLDLVTELVASQPIPRKKKVLKGTVPDLPF